MEENYLITIQGKQRSEGETDEINLTTLGNYVRKGDNRYIVFKEYSEENPNSSLTTVLKVEGEHIVTLMRAGSNGTRLIMEEHKRHLCRYATEFGSMMVGVFTNKVKSKLTDEGGNLEVQYTLDFNSDFSSMNEIFITIKEANSNVKASTAIN